MTTRAATYSRYSSDQQRESSITDQQRNCKRRADAEGWKIVYQYADHAISVTGIAGPDGGSDEKPVGTVFIGYSNREKTKSFHIVLPGDRYLIRWRSSQAALDYLRRQLVRRR